MTPLIDGDVLVYEIGFACEYGKEEIPSFEYVKEVLDNRIRQICEEVEATSPPVLFLTGKGNFRETLAVTKPYKGTRVAEKPYHYANIKAYLQASYGATLVEGYEADDALAMAQTSKTIICSRDKDLRMVEGWHFSWECGKQPQVGPYKTDRVGKLSVLPKKVMGYGLSFFYFQLLTGDSVDNIPGCKGIGPKKAVDLLAHLTDPLEMEQVCWDTYCLKHPEKILQELTDLFMEQAGLLWMITDMEDGELVHWKPTIKLEIKDED